MNWFLGNYKFIGNGVCVNKDNEWYDGCLASNTQELCSQQCDSLNTCIGYFVRSYSSDLPSTCILLFTKTHLSVIDETHPCYLDNTTENELEDVVEAIVQNEYKADDDDSAIVGVQEVAGEDLQCWRKTSKFI